MHSIETWNSVTGFILYGKCGDYTSERIEDQASQIRKLWLAGHAGLGAGESVYNTCKGITKH